MRLQEEEIVNITQQIELLQGDIDTLGVQIAAKEVEINQGIEDFKKRLRAMYMNGSDSLASILVGSSVFMTCWQEQSLWKICPVMTMK